MKRFFDVLHGFYTPYFDADDGSGGGGGNSAPDDDPEGEKDEGGKPAKTFTQEELDEIIAKRLKREREKQAEYEAKLKRLEELERAEEERKKAEMTEAERLKAEKEEAARKAQEAEEAAKRAQEAANRRVIDAEIRSIARALNAADPNDVLALIDKSSITIDEDGSVKGAEEAVKAFKEAKPHLFRAPIGADAGGGSNPPKNPNKSELHAKEKEYEELRAKALRDRRLLGKLNRLYHEIQELKARNK